MRPARAGPVRASNTTAMIMGQILRCPGMHDRELFMARSSAWWTEAAAMQHAPSAPSRSKLPDFAGREMSPRWDFPRPEGWFAGSHRWVENDVRNDPWNSHQ